MDVGLLPSNDLQMADNIQFSATKSRRKRDALNYFGTALPAVTHRSSSGTTRTLVFASSINIASPLDHILNISEKITITTTTTSGNEPTYAASDVAITGISTTTTTNDTITYTDSGSLAEGSTATSTITVARSSEVLCAHDYWYLDGSNVKQHYLMTGTTAGLFFRYDENGRRKLILADTSAAKSFVDGDVTTGTDTIAEASHGYVTGIKGQLTNSGGALPAGLAVSTNYYVIRVDANNYKLASSYANAILGTAVDITAAAGGGTHTFTPSDATAISGTLTSIHMATYNNKCIIALSGTGNTPKIYDALVDDEWNDLQGDPPDFSIMREHQGRLFTNQKTNPDRLHYCETFNHAVWNGFGDSGALDSSIGDGDPVGIRAISPSFKGELFITKRGKMERLIGTSPEDYLLVPITGGIGSKSHGSFVPVDQDDLFFVSPRGIHSIMATDRFGAFEGSYLSRKIQPTFNVFSKSALDNCRGVWISSINTVFWTFTEEDGTNALYGYSVVDPESPEWIRWPSVPGKTVCGYELSNERILIVGTTDGRLVRGQVDANFDFTSTPIVYRIKTGALYPENDALSIKAFKRISLLYRPNGNFSFTMKTKIDNFSQQSVSFSQSSGTDLLGTTFVLSTSILGSSEVFAPFTTTVEGYGRGITVEIEQSGVNEDLEIYGLVVEWEPADLRQEVVS